MDSNTARLEQPGWPIPARQAAGGADPAGAGGGIADAGRGDGSVAHYVITLTTAALPLRDTLPRLPAFADARVFCERYVEAGVARIRVQLGYFRSARAVAEALRVAQADYPMATVRGVRLLARPGDSDPDERTTPGPYSPAVRSVGTPAEVVATRRFAVELLWSPEPIDLAHVPPLTLFDGYTLYAVSAHRGGHDWHGLRLGFFTDRSAAMAAVDEATTYFHGAIAVPVSDSEFLQANEAEIRPFVARIGLVSFSRA